MCERTNFLFSKSGPGAGSELLELAALVLVVVEAVASGVAVAAWAPEVIESVV